MPMKADDIINLIQAGLPDAKVHLKDTVGDQDHYEAEVISASFEGLSKIQQHQLVYKALGDKMGGQLHALSLKTSVPNKD